MLLISLPINSHQVNVEQRSRVSNITQEVRSGSLYMVDLAGSERAAVTQVRVCTCTMTDLN